MPGKRTYKPRTSAKVDNVLYVKVGQQVEQYLRDGWLINEIRAQVLLDIPDIADEDFKELVKRAYEHASTTVHRNREYIFKLHMDRYEKAYQRSIVMVDRDQRPLHLIKDWHIMCAKYSAAMKSLKSKEDLVGLHNKDVVIQITEQDAVMKSKPENRGKLPFDCDKLTFEEQVELLALLKQAKVSEDDGHRRLLVQKLPTTIDVGQTVAEDVIDTIYEEMPPKVVDKLQVVDTSPTPAPDDVPKKYPQEVLDRLAEGPASDMEGVKKKIDEGTKKLFEKLLKNKKG
jgi:hypothetical protein